MDQKTAINSCDFLAEYASNVNIKELIDRAVRAANKLGVSLNVELIPVLMFFETPNNLYIERVKITSM